MSSTALNLEAIDKALRQHDLRCKMPVLAIMMNPFECERLGFDAFKGIPIREDEKMQTGRLRLVCDASKGGEGESVEEEADVEVGTPVMVPATPDRETIKAAIA